MLDKLLSIQSWRNAYTRHGSKFGWFLVVIFGLPLVIGFGWNQYGGQGSQHAEIATAQQAVIATVNGDPITQADFVQVAQRARGAMPGEEFAEAQGMALTSLVGQRVVEQEAKKRNVRPSDADIDRQLQEMRDQLLPKGASDAEWEQRIFQMSGKTLAEFREVVGNSLFDKALIADFMSKENVTDDEARKQNDEVKLALVLIPAVTSNPAPFAPKDQKPLPDAEAKQKAEDLLAKAKSGEDIAAIARAHSADFNAKKGGDTGWQNEYNGLMAYGKDFPEAVHKTAKGQFTEVIKLSGFQTGYAFAKVVDRRNTPPKDFDVKKAVEALKIRRAQEKANELVLAGVKAAKVEFKDPDKKVYYDLFQLKRMEQEKMMAQFGQGNPADAPTEEAIKKQRELVDAGFEALLKRDPSDATAALMVANILKGKRSTKGTTPEQNQQINDRLITLYETALRTTEGRDRRFELADLYREKKQMDKAAEQYARLTNLLAADPPYDTPTMQAAKGNYQRLEAGFRSVNKLEEADKIKANITKLDGQIAAEQKKLAEAQKAAKPLPGGTLDLSGGKSGDLNVDVPLSTGTDKAATPETKSDAPAPPKDGGSGAPKTGQ